MAEPRGGLRATVALGVGVPAAAFAWWALLPGAIGRPAWGLPALVLAGLAWAWSCARAERAPVPWSALVGGACLLRTLAFTAAPQTSDDGARYTWEALVLLDGTSPYACAPDAPELAHLRERWPELSARVAHADTPAAYPPLYQAASVGVVAAARAFGEAGLVERALALQRLFAAACDLAALFALRALLAARGLPPSRAVVWAWSPLAALEFAGAGHMDALGIALWIAGLALLERAARAALSARGTALVAAAALVKFLPALSLPFAWRDAPRGRVRAALAVAALAAVALSPLAWLHGGAAGLATGLADYGLRWESTSILYRFVELPLAHLTRGAPLDPRALGRGLCACLWAVLAWSTWRARTPTLRASWTLLAGFLVLSPTLHPWYLAWALPFLACFPSRAWTWLLAAAPLAYVVVARWHLEGLWVEPAWLWPVWVLPFLALGLRERLRRP